jgi:lipid-A-disaccharide synthase
MKYYLIAGEASGDLHASHLMTALLERDPDAQFRFFGGDMMAAVGGTLVRHYRDMAYMGFVQVVRHLPTILGNMKFCREDIRAFAPDALILIDYPSFNLKMAKFAKSLGLPVFYYISPKIWAWKEWRVKDIKRYVDRMLCILPFEKEFYARHGFDITYVGNPTLDEITAFLKKPQQPLRVEGGKELSPRPIVGIIAGSRRAEVRENLPRMLEAMRSFDGYQPVIAGAPGLTREFYREVLGPTDVPIVFGQTYELMRHARAALVTSGTATLETALLDTPQVVCYHVGGGPLFYSIMSRVLKVKYVSLVNLIADREIVSELLGYKFTTEAVIEHLRRILPDGEARSRMMAGYGDVRRRLGKPGAPRHAAEAIVRAIDEIRKA